MGIPPSTKRRRGAKRVPFLKHADRIRELLGEGHPQRTIFHDHLGGELALEMSYSQFNRYVKREILKPEPRYGHQSQGGVSAVDPAPDRPADQPKSANTAKPEDNGRTPFKFDPTASANTTKLV